MDGLIDKLKINPTLGHKPKKILESTVQWLYNKWSHNKQTKNVVPHCNAKHTAPHDNTVQ